MKQALILAAGGGVRLDRPGTPKPLVEVGGQPIIFKLINQLKHIGVEKVHVVLGYKKNRIRRAIAGHSWGEQMEIIFYDNNDWNQGMGRSVLAAKEHIKEPFFLLMGDHLFEDKLVATMAQSHIKDNDMIALIDRKTTSNHSFKTALKLKISSQKIIDVAWNLNECDALDAGFFIATPKLFEETEKALLTQKNVELCEVMKTFALQKKLGFVEITQGNWDDIDTPVDLVRAEAKIRQERRKKTVSKDNLKNDLPMPLKKLHSKVYDYVLGKPETVKIVVSSGSLISPVLEDIISEQSASSPLFVFTDTTVAQLYANDFVTKLKTRGYDVALIVLPVGEEAKTLSSYVHVVERVLIKGVDERSVFISLGGGVVCNVCGFVASTIYRGLDLVHIPTTLMAQCDAAISHKQAINGHRGKNMVGTYYSPQKVIVDVKTLQTLTDRQIRDGIAEVIKHGLGQDVHLADILQDYKGDFRSLDFLEQVIKHNIKLKCLLVKNDPKEQQEGMVLQYGHTIGHPIEHLSGYSLYHGESVAIGMMVAAKVARILGACSDNTVLAHQKIISKFGLPTKVPADICTDDILEALKFNKKYLVEGTRMALLTEVGKLWNVDGNYAIPVPDQVLIEAIEATKN